MDAYAGGAQAPVGLVRSKSRPITSFNTSAIVFRSSDVRLVDPEFDEDTYTRSMSGDTLYCAGAV